MTMPQQPPLTSNTIITEAQFAEIFHIVIDKNIDKQGQRMKRFLKQTGIPFFYVGREKRFRMSDVEAYINNNNNFLQIRKGDKNA